MSRKGKDQSSDRQSLAPIATIVAAVLGLIGTVTVAYFQFYLPNKLSIEATQTAEAKLALVTPSPSATSTSPPTFTPVPTDTLVPSTDTPTPIPPTATPTPSLTPSPTHTSTSTPTDTATPTPSPAPTNTPTPIKCEFNNLLACRDDLVPIFTPGQSHLDVITSSAQTVIFNFGNDQSYSGIVFKFSPALDVRGFTHLEIGGTSTKAFQFVVEYKVRNGEVLEIVADSDFKPFPSRVPLEYGGIVDEIALMFYVTGDASDEVTIESIRLSK